MPRDFLADPLRKFEVSPAFYSHDRSRKLTGIRAWFDYFFHGFQAWKRAKNTGEIVGIVTCFPQLPFVIGLCSFLSGRRVRVIAWAFNIGAIRKGLGRQLARTAFKQIDLFIVHSSAEVKVYSEWLGLPMQRFLFVPLQRPAIQRTVLENCKDPYVIALGSAQRDYRTLFSAVERLGFRTVLVTAAHAIEGLHLPPNVEALSNLPYQTCLELLQGARVHALVLGNLSTASGQVTLLDAMACGTASVVTACPGTADYVTHDEDALVIEPQGVEELCRALVSLWENEDLRKRLADAAHRRCLRDHSDSSAGRQLSEAMKRVESQSC